MSNKTYQTVTIEEMKEVLRAEKGWVRTTEPRSCEYFFEFPLSNSPHIIIKVASSITANGLSRGVGKDAIRVFAVDTQKQKGYISTKRVYRIGTWKQNLVKAVSLVYEAAKARRDGR